MRSRLSLLVLALAGLALGAPGAMSGAAPHAIATAAQTTTAASVSGSPVGFSVWLLTGALGIAVCAIALRRRPVVAAGRTGAAPMMADTPAEPTMSTTLPGISARITAPAESGAAHHTSDQPRDSTGSPSRQPAAV
jgi:hypothetical protein